MIRVFAYLLACSFKNRFTRQLARLRQPRYLVPFLVSLLWFGTWVVRPLLRRGGGRAAALQAMPAGAREALVLMGGIGIFLWIAALWLLPSKKAALRFSLAEMHFLFPAPVTRRQLVHYQLLKAQIGIFFGALVSAVFSGARLLHPEGWARVLALWLLFAIVHLHGIGASFVRSDLIEAGWSGARRRLVTLAVIAMFLVAVFTSAEEAWRVLVRGAAAGLGPDFPSTVERLKQISGALAAVGEHGLAGVLLWPFLALPRLLLAKTAGEFLRYGGIGAAIFAAHYAWVLSADGSFEEASLERAQTFAARRTGPTTQGGSSGRRLRGAGRFPWTLAPGGRPEVALVWKSLVNLSRGFPIRAFLALAVFLLATSTWAIQMGEGRQGMWLLVALLSVQAAAFTSVFGPVFLRNDLREDLFRIDMIKTMPLPGYGLLWGEVIGTWAALAALQGAALLVAAFALAMSAAATVGGLPTPWLFASGGAALLGLPALTLVAVALQNAMVVLFPAWVQVGNNRARGFEASGQRILTLFGTLLALVLVALPAAAVGTAVAWLLASWLGPVAALVGAAIAAALMVAEVALAIRLLGGVLDRLDPSTAGIQLQER